MAASLVPDYHNTVYLVLDDLGPSDRVWIETGEEEANEPTIVRWFIEEQLTRPLRVIAFNTEEGWSRDVSREIAEKLLDFNRSGTALGAGAREFVDRVTGQSARVIV
jgi:hypothetical protein